VTEAPLSPDGANWWEEQPVTGPEYPSPDENEGPLPEEPVAAQDQPPEDTGENAPAPAPDTTGSQDGQGEGYWW